MNHRLASLCIALALSTSAISQAPPDRTVPVRFAKGATSATLSGSVSGYNTVGYTLAARAGQTMALTLRVPGGTSTYFSVQAPGGDLVLDGTIEGQDAAVKLARTGTYTIRVFNMRNDARRNTVARYRLKISVN